MGWQEIGLFVVPLLEHSVSDFYHLLTDENENTWKKICPNKLMKSKGEHKQRVWTALYYQHSAAERSPSQHPCQNTLPTEVLQTHPDLSRTKTQPRPSGAELLQSFTVSSWAVILLWKIQLSLSSPQQAKQFRHLCFFRERWGAKIGKGQQD